LATTNTLFVGCTPEIACAPDGTIVGVGAAIASAMAGSNPDRAVTGLYARP